MAREHHVTRRTALRRSAAAAAAPFLVARASQAQEPVKRKGNIKHSASKWCYKMPLEKLAQACARLGVGSIELLGPGAFPTLKKHGLVCAMTSCNSIPRGFNRPEYHEGLIKNLRGAIDATAAAGFPNVICFSGNRKGMPDDVGLKNCAQGIKKVVGYAEKKGVTLCMEYLNSKQHKDYMCDSSAWAFELAKAVASPRFKILYDIYHAAMMEARIVETVDPKTGKKVRTAEHDLIPTITGNIAAIGHFHTGGYPGRHEIDDTQLLDYRAIMKAIAATDFDGWVGQEFIPRRKDKIASLAQAIDICDV
jgi:hydroxypyruvate isomerase